MPSNQRVKEVFLEEVAHDLDLKESVESGHAEMNQQVRALNIEEIVGINTQAENWHVQENQNYFHLAAVQDE